LAAGEETDLVEWEETALDKGGKVERDKGEAVTF
jgi:hypothetical protein